MTIGQNTGTDWVTANVILVNSTGYNDYYNMVPNTSFTQQNITAIHEGLASGQVASVNMKIPGYLVPSGPPGFVCSSYMDWYMWVQYQTVAGGPFQYTQIATYSGWQ